MSTGIQEHWFEDYLDRLTITGHHQDCKNYSKLHRLLLTLLLTLCASVDPVASTSYYPALPQVSKAFKTSTSSANLASSFDFAGVAITALYWSHASQTWGRKLNLAVALSFFVLFTVLGGISQSIGMLIAMRFFGSASATGIIITGIGVVGDLWEIRDKGFAISIFLIGPLTTPAIGPIVGGILTQKWGWRALQWFLSSYAAIMLTGILILLPETKGRTILEPKPTINQSLQASRKIMRKNSGIWAVRCLIKPLRPLAYLRNPFVCAAIYLASFTFSITAFQFISIQGSFSEGPYNYKSLFIGLLFLPHAAGAIIASLVAGRWSDHIMVRRAKACSNLLSHEAAVPVGPVYLPEARVGNNAWIPFILLPTALLSFGWTLHARLFWAIPMIPAFLVGAAAGLITNLVTTVLIELVPNDKLALIALNTIGRNACAAIAGSVAQPLLGALGLGWLYSGLGLIAAANVGVVYAIRRHGARWRENIWKEQNEEPWRRERTDQVEQGMKNESS